MTGRYVVVAVSGLLYAMVPSPIFVFIMSSCFFVSQINSPWQFGHFAFCFFKKFSSSFTGTFLLYCSSMSLSILKFALHFEQRIILSEKLSKCPEAFHTISGMTVGHSTSQISCFVNVFLIAFSILFFNFFPKGP